MGKPGLSFFAMLFILLFAVIGLILVVFSLEGAFFVFQLAVLLCFMFFLAFGMFSVYSGNNAGWSVVGVVLLLEFIDVSLIVFSTGQFGSSEAFAFAFAFIGMIVALAASLPARRKKEEETSHYDKQQYYYPNSEAMDQLIEESEEGAKEEAGQEAGMESKISATYTPGKFVASNKGNKFHMPKCAWAANIKKENQVWFDSEKEAASNGYKMHNCGA